MSFCFLQNYFVKTVHVHDPFVSRDYLYSQHKIELEEKPKKKFYDGVIISVDHSLFQRRGIRFFKKLLKKKSFVFDVKHLFNKKDSDLTL